MNSLRCTPGDVFLSSDSPSRPYTVVFEDDGETAYFYALDRQLSGNQIVDAVHIYNAASVVDPTRDSHFQIVWSNNAYNAVLLINGYPHAVFDFAARRGYCRTDFPNFPARPDHDRITDTHLWHEAVMDGVGDESK